MGPSQPRMPPEWEQLNADIRDVLIRRHRVPARGPAPRESWREVIDFHDKTRHPACHLHW
jgi:hypothetical protein